MDQDQQQPSPEPKTRKPRAKKQALGTWPGKRPPQKSDQALWDPKDGNETMPHDEVLALTKPTEGEDAGLPSEDSIPAALARARRQIDLSALNADNPRLIKAIKLLIEHGASHRYIRDALNVDFATIGAVHEANIGTTKEWKTAMARRMQTVLAAASGGLLKKAQEGDMTFLDAKFASEMALSLSGESLGSYEVNVVHSVADDFKAAIRDVKGVNTRHNLDNDRHKLDNVQTEADSSKSMDLVGNPYPDTEKDIEMLVTRIEPVA